jgi:hypothetical protein
LTWGFSHEIKAEFLDPIDPFALCVDLRTVPRWFKLLLVDRKAGLLSRD